MFRKLAVCVMLMLALCCAAEAERLLCINAEDVAALVDLSGREIIENGRFETIFEVREDRLFAAGGEGAYRLFNAKGEAVSEIEFAMIRDGENGLVYHKDGQYGVMSETGRTILEPRWAQLIDNGEGGWLALEGDPYDERADEILYINPMRQVEPTGVYTACGLNPVSCGRMLFMNEEGLWGAVDPRGKVIVEGEWRYLCPFNGGVAKALGVGGAGVIDIRGNRVLEPVYGWLEVGPALVAACDGEGVDLCRPDDGEVRFRLDVSPEEIALVGAYVAVTLEDEVRLYDAEGSLLVSAPGGTVYYPGTRGQLIEVSGAWGDACQRLINSDGRPASAGFQQILPLVGDRYAFLLMTGTAYQSGEMDREDHAWNDRERRFGLMDGSGRVLLPARCDRIEALNEQRLLLIEGGSVSLADRNGRILKTWPAEKGDGGKAADSRAAEPSD